jgi:hypothetical protein
MSWVAQTIRVGHGQLGEPGFGGEQIVGAQREDEALELARPLRSAQYGVEERARQFEIQPGHVLIPGSEDQRPRCFRVCQQGCCPGGQGSRGG